MRRFHLFRTHPLSLNPRPCFRLMLLGFLLLIFTIGCSHEGYNYQEGLAQRILPPVSLENHEELPTPKRMTRETSGEGPARSEQPKAGGDPDAKDVRQPKV